MKKVKKLLLLMSIFGTLIMVSCEEKEASCPDGMVSCDVGSNSICVPSNIGC